MFLNVYLKKQLLFMPKIKIVLFAVFLLNIFGNNSFAQNEIKVKKEILKLTDDATKYWLNENFEKSLITSRIALKKAILSKDDLLIATCYNTIAANYNDLSEYEKAILYYKKGLSYANRTNDDALKYRINNNLGNMYGFDTNEIIRGIQYYKKSLEYAEKIKDTSRVVFTKLNIAWAYFDIGHFSEGYKYLKLVNKYYDKYGNESTNIIFNMLNGMYYEYKGDNVKASFYLLRAIELGNAGEEKSDLSLAHKEYSEFLLKNGDYKKAYENLVLYDKITEDLYNKEKLNKAKIAGINLELDEYKREIDRIETEKDLQYKSLKKSRVIVLLFVIALFVLLLFLNSLIKNNRFKIKSNADLTLANAELIIANRKAEESSILKTQFISTISHELRTPLYGVVGITDLLLEEHKELASSPHLNSLKFSARYLLSLVNDILQINKIEENKVFLESLTFNISDEINMIKNSLSFIAQKYKNNVIIEIDPAIPEVLIGDKLRFSQIIMNLVSNALKFTKNGEVIVKGKLVKTVGSLYLIEFKIQDNGVGIAAIDQEKIFEKFIQIGRKEVDYQGTGLGLSIVRKLLELFGSSITVESEVGKGTVFTFSIAFEYDIVKANQIINNIQVDLASSQLYTVLVVEDNRINQLITKKILEKNNYLCTVVDDGYAALDILDIQDFDIILMDINMPLINGFETSRRIRQKGINIPIIALTAFDKNEITDQSINVGINDIIVKPFENGQLFRIINSLIRKNEKVF